MGDCDICEYRHICNIRRRKQAKNFSTGDEHIDIEKVKMLFEQRYAPIKN